MSIASKLRKCLEEGPPGYPYQYQMAPPHRPGSELSIHPPEGAKRASVLVPLYFQEGEVFVSMMRRPPGSGPHSSQISFPGGQREPFDTNDEATALRESKEELGIEPANVEILGSLSRLYIEPSNFLVYPFVGFCSTRPHFHVNPNEVAALLEFPIRKFLEPACRKNGIRKIRGKDREVPYFLVQGEEIWGASAMILSELLACWGRCSGCTLQVPMPA